MQINLPLFTQDLELKGEIIGTGPNKAWINIGSNVGLKDGDELNLIREGKIIGRVKVKKAGPYSAEIFQLEGEELQAGDMVEKIKEGKKEEVTKELPTPQEKEVITEKPLIEIYSYNRLINDKKTTFKGKAKGEKSPIIKVEFTVDNLIWQTASAVDGAFDSLEEEFNIIPTLGKDGEYQIKIRAENEAGNRTDIANYGKINFVLDTEPPLLIITKNYSGQILSKSEIEIEGKVEKDAKVYVNGEEVGVSDKQEFKKKVNLEQGKNRIEIKAEDLAGNQRTEIMEVTMKKKGRKKLTLYLLGGLVAGGAIALLSGGKGTGSIKISSFPQEADIYLDGQNTGQKTSATITNISVGNHTITLKKDRYQDWQKEIVVEKDKTTEITENEAILQPIDSGSDDLPKPPF